VGSWKLDNGCFHVRHAGSSMSCKVEQDSERCESIHRYGKPRKPEGRFPANAGDDPEDESEANESQPDRAVEPEHEEHAERVVACEQMLVKGLGLSRRQEEEHAQKQHRAADGHRAA